MLESSSRVLLDYEDVAIVPKASSVSSRSEVSVTIDITDKLFGVPIIVANLDVTGTISMARAMTSCGAFTCLSKYVDLYKAVEFIASMGDVGAGHTFVTVGPNGISSEIESIRRLVSGNGVFDRMSICLDAANGYSKTFVDALNELRQSFPGATIMAGNVCTAEGAEALAGCGANIVKVGIGSGGLCTTRNVTGVGIPQISAIAECRHAVEECFPENKVLVREYSRETDSFSTREVVRTRRPLICGDGGIKQPGDAVKAIAAGADMVMAGSYFVGTDECMATDLGFGGKMAAWGSASEHARQIHGKDNADYSTAEGITRLFDVSHTSARDKIRVLLGGIRSACAYVGATSVSELYSRAMLVRKAR